MQAIPKTGLGLFLHAASACALGSQVSNYYHGALQEHAPCSRQRSKPSWIDADLVLAIYDRLLVEHDGAKGVRDESLLQAALSRPVNHIAYASSHTIELAAGAIDENGFGEFLRADSKRNKWQATMPSAG